MKYRELLGEAGLFLKKNDVDESDNNAWLLFEKAFSMSRSEYLLRQAEEAGCRQDENVRKFNEWLNRRAMHEPLQYITGVQNFMGFDFKVTPDVLIPRFDTEILVENVLKYIDTLNIPEISVLDMCTGSGCIAISIALLAKEKNSGINVTGVDISQEALKVAKDNAQRLRCGNIRLLKSDLFDEVSVDKFDIIVSNPPYIKSGVIDTLSPEVKDYEPRLALDGSGDGLYFYRRIAEEASNRLNKGGKIFFEIGCDQGEQVGSLLAANGFKNIEVIKDLAGLDRVAAAGKD